VVVIFGFGPGKQEDLGEVAPGVCPNCHNQVFLHHVRSKKSVRLYFVPVVPYGTDDYLVCPVCSRGLQISSAQLPHVRSMTHATGSFRARRLTQAQYLAQVEQFWRRLGVNTADRQLFAPATPTLSPGAPPATTIPGTPPATTIPGAPPATAVPDASPATTVRAATSAPPAPVSADDDTSWISQLRKLALLHDQGVLSDADYTAAKQRVIEQKD
jgi:hypothetical protein